MTTMISSAVAVVIVAVVLQVHAQDNWHPTDLIHCRTNDDCHNQHHCCSITAALGKRVIQGRAFPPNWDGNVHYCLSWKNETAQWCELKLQYSPDTPNYYGLCPCGPGLACTPTDQLDEKYYPREKFGKCTQVTST